MFHGRRMMEHAGNYAMNCDGIWCLFHPFFRTASASAILGAACRVDIDNAELDSARFDHFECVPLCVYVCMCVCVCVCVYMCVCVFPLPLYSLDVCLILRIFSPPLFLTNILLIWCYLCIFYVMYVALCATSVEADVHNLRVTILMKICLFFGGYRIWLLPKSLWKMLFRPQTLPAEVTEVLFAASWQRDRLNGGKFDKWNLSPTGKWRKQAWQGVWHENTQHTRKLICIKGYYVQNKAFHVLV